MKTGLFITTFFIFSILHAQPTIQWQKCLGGSSNDVASSIQQTTDGGYIVAGNSLSNDSNVSGNHGGTNTGDYWVVKIDNNGNIQWQKSLGGSNDEEAHSVQQTYDGGYIIAGATQSNDGDVSGNHGASDYWIVKLDSVGNIKWQKTLGGSAQEVANSICQTSDSGYIVAGYSFSADGDVTGKHGSEDYWIVKLDSIGNIKWQKALGGDNSDEAQSIIQTKDGGYIVAGTSSSTNGNVTGNHGVYPYGDYWIVKLDNVGNIQWQKCYGGSDADECRSIQETKDGGYIIVGDSRSIDGDVSNNHGSYDYWVVKIDDLGTLQWQKSLGGTNNDIGLSILQTVDLGYIVTGSASSNNGDVTGSHGSSDSWSVNLDSSGNMIWQKCFGGSAYDESLSIKPTSDGGYVLAGGSTSNNGDVSGNHGSFDYWIIKWGSLINSVQEWDTENPIRIYSNVTGNNIHISSKNDIKNGKVNLYNLMGEEIYSDVFNGNEKMIYSQMSAGIYFVQITKGNETWTQKIIKE